MPVEAVYVYFRKGYDNVSHGRYLINVENLGISRPRGRPK